MIHRYLYEHSVAYHRFLILPCVYQVIHDYPIYSYWLLSERGHKDTLHQAENPAKLYSSNLKEIEAIAKSHLDDHISSIPSPSTYFSQRYVYRDHLIIIHNELEKYFYDHYPPHELTNIAAPKLFDCESDCLAWIQAGLLHHTPSNTNTR